MKLLLINPPTHYLDTTDLSPPLGLLVLAAVARQAGYDTRICDLNLEVLADPTVGGDGFYDHALKLIFDDPPDVVGLTSMCMESHVSLEIARCIKARSLNTWVVLGGTHFGTIANEVLTQFPFVDFVVSGEGEAALLDILAFVKERKTTLPQNVFYRDSSGVISGTKPTERPSLEALPFPAYNLVDPQKYFTLNPCRTLCYDSGRGCVFKCAFCYSPFHYGDAVRNRSTDGVVSDLEKLSELGCEHVFFVQDNLLNSPKWAAELCEKIETSSLPITWSCYVTYPQLTEQLIDSLSRARCTGIFTGIDAVAPDSQLRMNKRFLRDWQVAKSKLSHCVERGVIPTCAFILEGPEQPVDEIEATLHTAIECVALGGEVHINTLTIYNGSALEQRFAGRLPVYSPAKVELLMDASPVVQRNPYGLQLPRLFPYHSTYSNPQQWAIFLAKVQTVFGLLHSFTSTLWHYVVEEGQSLWKSLDYIDHEFALHLGQQRQEAKRLIAIQKFAEHFDLQLVSSKIRKLFQEEFWRFVLSQPTPLRRVELAGDQGLASYLLGRYVETSILADQSEDQRTDDQGTAGGRSVFALLSSEKIVKFWSVDQAFAQILRQCEQAANSNSCEPLYLGEKAVRQLEREGWIWSTPSFSNSSQ